MTSAGPDANPNLYINRLFLHWDSALFSAHNKAGGKSPDQDQREVIDLDQDPGSTTIASDLKALALADNMMMLVPTRPTTPVNADDDSSNRTVTQLNSAENTGKIKDSINLVIISSVINITEPMPEAAMPESVDNATPAPVKTSKKGKRRAVQPDLEVSNPAESPTDADAAAPRRSGRSRAGGKLKQYH